MRVRRVIVLFAGALCLVETSAAQCQATAGSGRSGACGGGSCEVTLNRAETHRIAGHRTSATVATAVACLGLTHLIATHVVCEAGGESFQRKVTGTAAAADADGRCLRVRFTAPEARHWHPVGASEASCG